MVNKEFKTILGQYNNQIEINKSIFITNIKRCNDEEESVKFIEEISSQYRDATHNCTAYINGENQLTQRYNDDGEPSGTAGIPMLEVLKKEELTNICAVVTRYFGGKKLGASGLIRAYGQSVSECIKKSEIIWFKNYHKVKISFEYPYLGKIDNFISNNNFFIKDRKYLDIIENIMYISINEFEFFKTQLMEITSANINLEILETVLLKTKNNEIIE
ncbi:YigZ family protein [Helcococcus kunzii]|uniref:YigZ family protein n=1 Tax=Helcococcus kunzii TaxID=40091 RepID=UPI001C9664C6|nr:YigZ family protein [Helcococcus kunzii]QZO77284.1 YigZ family protein [Helcococcus kunzii]